MPVRLKADTTVVYPRDIPWDGPSAFIYGSAYANSELPALMAMYCLPFTA